MRNRLSISAFLLLAAVAFTALLLIPPAARITVLRLDGTVVYDSDHAQENHAGRVEFQKALRGESASVIRHSETTGTDLLYSAMRFGGLVVRLAIPSRGLFAPLLLARIGFILAGVLGALTAFLLVRFGRKIDTARANEAFRREFTANVTHELRTPLTALLGAVEMLGDGSSLTEAERTELLDIIREQAGRLNALSGDVLALAQLERGQQEDAHGAFAPVDTAELLKRVAELEASKARAQGIELVVAQGDAATVQGDVQLLEQALVNLVENALRYPGSDRVELSCHVRDRREAEDVMAGQQVAADAHELRHPRPLDGEQVELAVVDFGVGIAARHLPRLFERFYRVDKARSRALGGTGLGLAIVKHIAQVHGGDVAVSSEPGVRTEFRLALPL